MQNAPPYSTARERDIGGWTQCKILRHEVRAMPGRLGRRLRYDGKVFACRRRRERGVGFPIARQLPEIVRVGCNPRRPVLILSAEASGRDGRSELLGQGRKGEKDRK